MEEIPNILNERKEEILNRLDLTISYARRLKSPKMVKDLQNIEKLVEELN